MARLTLLLAVCALATAAPLVRLAAPAPALTVAAVRVSLAAIALLVVARGDLGPLLRLRPREQARVVAAGLLLGLHFGVWITSLYFTSTASSLALVATNPAFAALIGWLALREPVGRRAWGGIVVAAAGCVILAGGDVSLAGGALAGDLLALAGAATAACYLVVGRSLRAAVPLFPYLAAVNLIAGAGLTVAALVAGSRFAGFPAATYAALVAAALIPSLIGHTLLNWSVRRAPAHLVALTILGEPVGASLLAWALFAERPPPLALAGGAVILLGILFGFSGKKR